MSRTIRILGATALAAGLLCSVNAAEPEIDDITAKMGDVVTDLERTETGEPVQTRQKEVVRDLDALIAALEKQCEACRGGMKRNNPNRGMRDSVISRGTGGMGTLGTPGESQKDWAKLSPRERDRILQSMSEGFPPEYRTVLERYYRRLAEEKSAPAEGGRTRAKTAEPAKAKP